ncbi:hypothetical protein AVEN_58518-1 [Araneus ventricosus]|uniref:Uncharacterized protein n=1 Tax=Araneus ventricosus TaxID=182803 RepID=A0A4Y2IBM9_ARAVE|nr:hypothetical protein AVEN_58518-1 [Araneus ventricosus]
MILTDFLPHFYQGRVCKYASRSEEETTTITTHAPRTTPPTTTRHSPSPHDYDLSTARSVSHNTNKKRMKANERASNRSIEPKIRCIRSRTNNLGSFVFERKSLLIRSQTKEPKLFVREVVRC